MQLNVRCTYVEEGRKTHEQLAQLFVPLSAKTLIRGTKITAGVKLNTIFLRESPLLLCCPAVINEHGLFYSLASLPFTVLNMLS